MEPTLMILGQAATTAATQGIEAALPVRRVDYNRLRARLDAHGQVLESANPAGATRGAPVQERES